MPDWKTFIKYAIVGASGVVVNTVFLYALTEYVGLFYIFSGIIAAELSILNNFIWNEKWTFNNNSKGGIWTRFVTFQIISILGTATLLIIMVILTTWFGIYYVYSSWIGVGITFIMNYVLNKYITWGKDEQPNEKNI